MKEGIRENRIRLPRSQLSKILPCGISRAGVVQRNLGGEMTENAC